MGKPKNSSLVSSCSSITSGIPRFSPETIIRSAWSLPSLIILAVFIFNLSNLFPDLLWHDDGSWYYKASEGWRLHNAAWRMRVCTLAPYLDSFYSYGMIHLGLPLIRGIFVLVMALSSVSVFFLYRDSLGFNSRVALPAAILPNILPSLIGIPAGLNTSYAMWGLFPIVICLLLLTRAFRQQGVYSWISAGLSLVFYYLGLNLPGQPSSNFLIPCVLFFLVLFFPSQKIKTLLLLLPFLGMGAWQLYKQALYSHREPVNIPLEEMLSRIRQFFEMSDFLAFSSSFSIYLTSGLILFGLAGLVYASPSIFKKPDHFNYSTGLYRTMLTGWPLCWMAANSLAYVAASPECRTYDYAYIFNFGSVLLQVIGLTFLAVISFRFLRINKHKNLFSGILIFLIILSAGVLKFNHRHDGWGKEGKLVISQASALIRKTLSEITLPHQAQIIILGAETIQPGNYRVNSGYLRYLLARNDISGLIGPDTYPGNVFARWRNFSDQMLGFADKKPIIAFRYKGGRMERLNFLLQVVSTGERELPRLRWNLFDISAKNKIPNRIHSGEGISSYFELIKSDLYPELRNADIAFAPEDNDNSSTFIDEPTANQMAADRGILETEISFEDQFTIRNIFIKKNGKNTYLQFLFRVDQMPQGKTFRLGYTLDGLVQNVTLWNYVMEGDHLLINSPPVDPANLSKGLRLSLIDAAAWPPTRPLAVRSTPGKGEDSVLVIWSHDGEAD